jgi:hypothetical protein
MIDCFYIVTIGVAYYNQWKNFQQDNGNGLDIDWINMWGKKSNKTRNGDILVDNPNP